MRHQYYILCLTFSLLALSSSWAEWEADIVVTSASGNSQELAFGENPGALDGFDIMDVPFPPLPPDELLSVSLDAVFMITGPFPRLTTDVRQQRDSNQWELVVWSNIEDMTLTWDISDSPSDKSISLTCLDEDITVDMRTENSLILPRGLHTLIIGLATEPVEAESNNVSIKGDVNGNGQVNFDDAVLILQFLVGTVELSSYHRISADVNGDGKIRLDDVVLLLNILRSAPTLAAPGTDSITLDENIISRDKAVTTWAAIKTTK